MATLSLNRLHKSFGDTPIIKDLSLEIGDGEFVVFVGPSGCGKSTLVRMIAGLEDITAGDLLIDGVRVNEVPPADRGLAMVFQSYALYPHMTVRQNMGFALRLAGVSRTERDRKVLEAARLLHLEPFLEQKPGRLSGGQRQRVAIGRAIVRNPKIFLFDEPLSNLDAELRGQMRTEIARLHAKLGTTMIYVTHDQIEAMTMADRIVVLRNGTAEQVDTPLEIYGRPANTFVASFIGSPRMNMFTGSVLHTTGDRIVVQLASAVQLAVSPPAAPLPVGTRVTVGIRPEHLRPHEGGELAGRVTLVEHLGAATLVHIALASGDTAIAQVSGTERVRVGDRFFASADPAAVHLFGANGQTLGRTASGLKSSRVPL